MNERTLVRNMLSEKGLTVEGFAFKSGKSYSTVMNWLKGKDVSLETMRAFAGVMDLSLDELIRLSSQQPTHSKQAI